MPVGQRFIMKEPPHAGRRVNLDSIVKTLTGTPIPKFMPASRGNHFLPHDARSQLQPRASSLGTDRQKLVIFFAAQKYISRQLVLDEEQRYLIGC